VKFVPQSLGGRLALALAVAVGAVAGLDAIVSHTDAQAAARDAAVRAAPLAQAPVVGLLPAAGEILLATRIEAVPAEAAPVVQVTANGGFAVLRGSPRDAPGAAPRPAAILLPAAFPGRLDAATRATLAEVIARLASERPVRAARFRSLGFRLDVFELERLLAWLP